MMRGASADALAELSDKLDTAGTLADVAQRGEDLFGVAAVLRTEPALRRALSDVTAEADAKVGLVTSIFGKALAQPALDVLSDAVTRRWTVSRDLPAALEHLAVVSTVQSAGKAGEKISDELFAVRRMIDSAPELGSALLDLTRTSADRSALLGDLVDKDVLPATARLLQEAVTGPHHTVDAAISEYQRVAAGVHGEILATVHTARELDASERTRLSEALGKQYATTVHLQVVVDPGLVGGLRVEIADDVIDGTVSGRLDDARRRLAG